MSLLPTKAEEAYCEGMSDALAACGPLVPAHGSAVALPHHYAFSHEATPQKLWNAVDMRDYAAAVLVAGQQWTKDEPTEGSYWMWDGDPENAPIHVEVMRSGFENRCFVPAGQWGWTRPQSMDELEGCWWSPLAPPPLPNE